MLLPDEPESANSTPPTTGLRARVWDLPTRLCHWAIVLLVTFLFITGRYSLLPAIAHLWAGYLLLIVLIFRMLWGIVGGDSARFGRMFPGPRAVADYLPQLFSPSPTRWPGHNPVGALSALLMLVLLLAQCVTGLFVETWSEVRGPLAERVSRHTMQAMSDLHDLLSWLLLIVVLIHVAATLLYLFGKHENRIAGIFGDGRVDLEHKTDLRFVSVHRAWLALVLSLTAVVAVIWLGPVA